MITAVLRQLFSLTVAGAASGLCKQPVARTDFPFHRVAKGGDGTLSKRSYVSDGEVGCQLVCLADFGLVNLRPTRWSRQQVRSGKDPGRNPF